METDSPNLFDSEPVPVKLTAAADPVDSDDVLAEIIGEIRDGDKPSGVEISVDDGDAAVDDGDAAVDDGDAAVDDGDAAVDDGDAAVDDGNAAVDEYHTDVSDDENEEDQPAVDQLAAGEQDEDSAKAKTKDVHKGLPPGRVKLIMKMDPDVNIVAGDAVFLVTKATESFVALLAQHCHKAMVASNKKTLKKQHIDAVIEENVPFEFLDGALDW